MTDDTSSFAFEDSERLLGWLQTERNPDLWHHIVFGMNFDSRHTLDYIGWIVRQSDCDVATAAAVLILCEGWRHVFTPRDSTRETDPRLFEIASTICHGSESGAYTRARIGWHAPDYMPTPTATLARIYAACAERGIAAGKTTLPVPRRVLGADFDKPQAPVEYFIDETGLYHLSTMDPFMQEMMGYRVQ